jgi:hypothetical protein
LNRLSTLLLVALVACDDGNGGAPRSAVGVALGDRTTIRWTAPTANADGSSADLAGFKVYWGIAPRNYCAAVVVDDPSATKFALHLAPGTYYFAVSAVGVSGAESTLSSEVSKTVR